MEYSKIEWMIGKAEISCHFRKSVDCYDDNALVQKQIVDRLCGLLQKFPSVVSGKVLEIGCGTGLLTSEIQAIRSDSHLYINDLVYEMCSKTASKCNIPASCWFVGDIESIPLPAIFDLMVSSSTFQWFTSPVDTFKKLADHLAPQGFLVFSTFGTENLKELRSLTGQGLSYSSLEELKMFLSADFDILHVEEQFHTLYFSHPVEVLRHVKNTGVKTTADPRIRTKGQMMEFEKKYTCQFLKDGSYPLTYHPLYFICRKKNLQST